MSIVGEFSSGSSLRGVLRAGAIAGFGLMLPGCPLSDPYFVETAPGAPTAMGGRGPGPIDGAGRANGNGQMPAQIYSGKDAEDVAKFVAKSVGAAPSGG
mgnify:CR=1 FL=1